MDDPEPSLRPLLVRVLAAGALLAVASLAVTWTVPGVRDPATIREYVAGFGPLAPVVFVLVQTLQVLLAPIPGQVVAAAGGYLFGVWHGAAYSLVGMTLGSTVAFVLSRRFGRPYVSDLVGPRRLARFDAFVDRSGLPGVFALFLLPGLPDDVVCFVAGVTRIRLSLLVVAAAVGRFPGLLLASFVGAEVATGRLLVAGAVVAVLLVAWVVGYYYRHELLDLLNRYVGDRA